MIHTITNEFATCSTLIRSVLDENAQGVSHSLLSEQDIRKLDRDLRILIATNGTLASILKVIGDDEIVVDVIKQQFHLPPSGEPEFVELPIGRVLQRQAVLGGRDSGVSFVAAESLIAVDRLPAAAVTDLAESNLPIGEIMTASCLETFKEAAEVWIGELPAWVRQSGRHNGLSSAVARRYRIIAGGQPLISLTEYFLWDSF